MDPLGLCSPGGGGRTVCWESRGTQTTPARCPVSPLPLSRHRGSELHVRALLQTQQKLQASIDAQRAEQRVSEGSQTSPV